MISGYNEQGFGGFGTGIEQYVNRTTDLTLTSATGTIVSMISSVPNLSIILPDATQLGTGRGRFLLLNEGNYAFNIKDGGGGIVATVMPGFAVEMLLLSTTTVSGKWRTLGGSRFTNPGTGGTVLDTKIFSSSAFDTHIVLPLTASSGVVVWLTSARAVSAQAYTIDASNVLTFGTAVSVATATNKFLGACQLDSTRFAMCFTADGGTNDNYVFLRVGSVAGTTITQGTVRNCGTSDGLSFAGGHNRMARRLVVPISGSNRVVVMTQSGPSWYHNVYDLGASTAVTYVYSGSTSGESVNAMQAVALGGMLGLFYTYAGAGLVRAREIQAAGFGTVSAPAIWSQGGADEFDVIAMTSTNALLVWNDPQDQNRLWARVVTLVAPNSITMGPAQIIAPFNTLAPSVAALSATEARVFYRDTNDGNRLKAVDLVISGNSFVSVSPPIAVNTNSAANQTSVGARGTVGYAHTYADADDGGKGKIALT